MHIKENHKTATVIKLKHKHAEQRFNLNHIDEKAGHDKEYSKANNLHDKEKPTGQVDEMHQYSGQIKQLKVHHAMSGNQMTTKYYLSR
jgi:hypothetical protein